jgi:prepilin-type N-terminal cleavage/methylation domain-containing protein
MIQPSHRRRRGFTFLEILMTVGVLALLVVVAFPGMKRSGLRETAERIKEDLEQIQQAVAAVAKEKNAAPEAEIAFEEYREKLRKGSALQKKGQDPFGNAYGPQPANAPPKVPAAAAKRLREVAGDDYWAPFVVGE